MSAAVRRLVRVVADVEAALHARLVAQRDLHGVSLEAVVAAAIQAGLPAVERWPAPGGSGGRPDTHHADR